MEREQLREILEEFHQDRLIRMLDQGERIEIIIDKILQSNSQTNELIKALIKVHPQLITWKDLQEVAELLFSAQKEESDVLLERFLLVLERGTWTFSDIDTLRAELIKDDLGIIRPMLRGNNPYTHHYRVKYQTIMDALEKKRNEMEQAIIYRHSRHPIGNVIGSFLAGTRKRGTKGTRSKKHKKSKKSKKSKKKSVKSMRRSFH